MSDDIKLPAVPGRYSPLIATAMRDYARDAIKSDRQHMASEYRKELDALSERNFTLRMKVRELEADRQQRGEPDYFTYVVNGHHRGISETMPPDDAYDAGTLVLLYTAPHPAEPDYKQLYEQMCERCDYLDAKLAEYSERESVNGFYDPGMSLRDWFAGMSLQAMVTNEQIACQPDSAIAESAYDLADAMIAQREK